MTELKVLTPDVTRAFLAGIKSGAISSRQPDHANENDPLFIRGLTAERYLSFCALFIRAIWPPEDRVSVREIYRGWADGRHGGLLDLPPHSAHGFSSWLVGSQRGGSHPFEFIRDKMLLWIHEGHTDRQVWLRLLKRKRFVSADMVVAAVALHSERVPVCIEDAEIHAVFAAGDDFVGIADERAWEIGSPKWPADAGILDSACQSFFVSEVARFPALLNQIEWFPGSKVLVEVH